LIISSALKGSILRVYRLPEVRSFSFTVSLSLLTWHVFALELIATNLSTSVISDGIILYPRMIRCDGCKAEFLSVLVHLRASIYKDGKLQLFYT